MTATYIALATITLGSAQQTVTFSSIPATYRDLVLVVSGRCSTGNQLITRFNGSTSGYSEVVMLGYAPGAISYTVAVSYFSQMAIASNSSTSILQVMDYAQTNKHKSVLIRNAFGGESVFGVAGRWANTAAVDTISLRPEGASDTFSTGTVLSLYGIN